MDYSKTHYYKYTAPAQTSGRQVKPNVPVFENDINVGTDPGPVELPTPSLPDLNQPASPDIGPEGLPTPSLPSDIPSTPVETYPPSGSITVPFPPYNSGNSGNNNILWSYTWSTPLFSSMSAVAQARFYNVNTMSEPVDIYINGQLAVSNLGFTEYTDYLYIIPGYYDITIYRRNYPNYPLINTRVNFVRNSVCTVALIGTLETAGLQFVC